MNTKPEKSSHRASVEKQTERLPYIAMKVRSNSKKIFRSCPGFRSKSKLAFPVMIIMVLISIIIPGGCYRSKPAEIDVEIKDPFTRAFQEKNYGHALEIAREQIALAPNDGMKRLQKAACLAMLNRFEDAVESFRMAEVLHESYYPDRTSLYLQATALFNAGIFSSAQATLDSLTDDFPYSKMTQMGQSLALKIQKRLSEEITDANLNWYFNKGITAYNAARPALAVEYLEEYLFLADKSGRKKVGLLDIGLLERTNFSLGGAYLELGLPKKAMEYLKQVSPDYMDYRAAFLLALALKADGNEKLSGELLVMVANQTRDEYTRKQASRYLERMQ